MQKKKNLPPPLLSTFLLGKKGGRAARAEALFSPPPTWLTTARHPRLHAVLWPTFGSEQRSRRKLLTLASRHSCQVCRHSPSLYLLRCTLVVSLNTHRDKLDHYKGIIQGRNNLNIYFSSCLLLSPLSSHGNKPIYNFTHTNTLDTHGKHLLVSWGEILAQLLLLAGKTSSTQIHCKPWSHLTKRLLQFSERRRTWSNWKDLDLDATAQRYCSGWDQREAAAALQEDCAASQDNHWDLGPVLIIVSFLSLLRNM